MSKESLAKVIILIYDFRFTRYDLELTLESIHYIRGPDNRVFRYFVTVTEAETVEGGKTQP